MRWIVFLLIVLFVWLGAEGVYMRAKTDRLLNQALQDLPAHPAKAFVTFRPVCDMNDALTLGKVGAAKDQFVRTLTTGAQRMLATPPTSAEAFQQAGEAVHALSDYQQATSDITLGQREAIMTAVRDAVPGVRDQGTLTAWDAMVAMMPDMDASGYTYGSVFEDYKKWFAQVKAVDRRPLGIRDAAQKASAKLRAALGQIHLQASSDASGPLAVAMPNGLDAYSLCEAEKRLDEALDALKAFQNYFKEESLAPELLGLYAIVHYNRGVLRVAHLIDGGPELRGSGSAYIYDRVIRPDAGEVPTAQEMLIVFSAGAHQDLQEAEAVFPQAFSLSDPLRRVYAGLAAGAAAMQTSSEGADPGPARNRMAGWFANIADPRAQSVATSFAVSPRPYVVVDVP